MHARTYQYLETAQEYYRCLAALYAAIRLGYGDTSCLYRKLIHDVCIAHAAMLATTITVPEIVNRNGVPTP